MAKKSRIPALYPKRKWLSLEESMAWLNMSKNSFLKATIGLTFSQIGAKKFYRVEELDALIERNVVVKQVA